MAITTGKTIEELESEYRKMTRGYAAPPSPPPSTRSASGMSALLAQLTNAVDELSKAKKEIVALELTVAGYRAFTDADVDTKAVDEASEMVIDNIEFLLTYDSISSTHRINLSGTTSSGTQKSVQQIVRTEDVELMGKEGIGISMDDIFIGFKK